MMKTFTNFLRRTRTKALALAVMLVFTTVVSLVATTVPVKADGGVTLRVHYHRSDGDYSTFNSVWLWTPEADGAQYYFEETDGEMVATMEVPAGSTTIGYIVRSDDWAKDIEDDQFMDITEVVSGTVDAYIESGVEGCTLEYEDDVVTGIRVRTAQYNGDSTLTVEMTAEIDDYATAFSLSGSAGSISITGAEDMGDAEYLLTLGEELDTAKTYNITYDGEDTEVSFPNVYSTDAFEEQYTYDGDDLGATWSADSTTFRVWAPTAQAMYVNLYEGGTDGVDDQTDKIEMTSDVNGTWVVTVDGDLNGVYYTYTVVFDSYESETIDPYAKACGVNGKRGMVIDLDSTDPDGWDEDVNPHAGEDITDAIIYELQVRDFSADSESGITNVGKYLAFTETGTTTSGGQITGIDYLQDLGITHLHLLPTYDFGSVDETSDSGYNWGYDPVNYNIPEGSYSTDPYDGAVRIEEYKEMVQSLHNAGISVIADVVFNHVYSAGDFSMNVLVPGYFSRINDDGSYSNGSGCGNDTATERSMVRKFIVDSVNYWVDEYHIDGFRFDIVGLIDTETMNEIIDTVHETHPDVIFYGEGWSLTTDVTKDGVTLATQTHSTSTPELAFFSDTMRDALKGSVFSDTDLGYASGSSAYTDTIRDCFQAITSWSTNPSQIVNYASCHDNMTLFAKILNATSGTTSFEDEVKMNNLAAAVYMTSEGIPFMMAGEEMLRTKETSSGTYDSNSYNSGDEVNALQWANLEDDTYQQVYQYYKGLIAFRKAHKSLRLTTADEVAEHVTAVDGLSGNVVAMDVDADVEGETVDEIFVIFNPDAEETTVDLPDGEWTICVNGESAGTESLGTAEGSVTVEPISAMILTQGVKEVVEAAEPTEVESTEGTNVEKGNSNLVAIIVAIIVIIVIIVIIIAIVLVKRKGGKKDDQRDDQQ